MKLSDLLMIAAVGGIGYLVYRQMNQPTNITVQPAVPPSPSQLLPYLAARLSCSPGQVQSTGIAGQPACMEPGAIS